MFHEKNISKFIKLIPIIFIVLTAIVFTLLHVNDLNKKFSIDSQKLKEELLAKEKDALYDKVASLYDYIEYKRMNSESLLKQNIKQNVEVAYNIVANVYNRKVGIESKENIKKEIKSILSKIRYKEDDYYFLQEYYHEKKVISLLNSPLVNFDGKNISQSKNPNIQDYYNKLVRLMNKEQEGYIEYLYDVLPSSVNQKEKISYVKFFKPLNVVIGYGEFTQNITKEIQSHVLKRLNAAKFAHKNGYVYAIDSDYTLLQHSLYEEYVGENFIHIDDNKQSAQLIMNFIEDNKLNKNASKERIIYASPSKLHPDHRISIVKYIPQWNWILIGKICVKDLDKNVENLIGNKKAKYRESIMNTILITFILTFLVSIVSFFISRKISEIFKQYKQNIESQKNALRNINVVLESKIAQKTKELEKLNAQLQVKVNDEVLKNRRKDQILYHQSKMASMGEMIGNIAHQWRQPLSTISTAASGMGLKLDYDIFKKEDAKEDIELIVNTTRYLSETIDDFRNFFAEEKKMEQLDLSTVIKNSINLISASLKNNHIQVIEDLQAIQINVIKNELSQGILNILTNAKDVLCEHVSSKQERLIFIQCYEKQHHAYIHIKDNGGGIPMDILEKIYEPYFTTKHKSQGTGIGLYMTREIIIKHLNGDIETKNTHYTYDDISYTGAEFIIKIPL